MTIEHIKKSIGYDDITRNNFEFEICDNNCEIIADKLLLSDIEYLLKDKTFIVDKIISFDKYVSLILR